MTAATATTLRLDRLPNSAATLPAVNKSHDTKARFHLVGSSDRSERLNNGVERSEVSAQTIARNAGRKLSRSEIERQLSDALAEAIPQYVAPAKSVAAEIEASPRTVDNLRQRVPEAMVTLVMLGRAYPKLGSQVARLMALEAEHDPLFQREFAEFIRRAREA